MEKQIGERVYLRFWQEIDAEKMCELVTRNRDQVGQYSPERRPQFYTVEGQREIVVRDEGLRQEDRRYSFGIFLRETDEPIGGVMLTNVVRDPLQTCMIGYYVDESHNGKGYMTEAVRLAVTYGFEELDLHRIEAEVMPRNIGSVRVLAKCGFAIEGTLRHRLKVKGVWEDHYILSIINEGQE